MVDALADEVEPVGYRALPGVPGLVRLLLSALCSRTASRMYSVLLVLFVIDVYHSAALSGIVVISLTVPGMIVSPVAGALLDRRGRLQLISIDYFVGGVTFSLLCALSLMHDLPRFALVLIVAVGALTQPLSQAGTRSLVPAMVPTRLWDRVNAVDSTGYVIANICGPAVAGGAVAIFGPRVALLVPSVFMVLAATLLIGLPVPDLTVASENSILTDALAGLRYVWDNIVLRILGITLSFYFGASGVLTIALPLLIEHRLGMGSVAVGCAFAASGAAGFFSGLISGRLGTDGHERSIFAIAGVATAAALVIMAFTHSVVVVFLAMALIGASNGPLMVAMFSIRQRATDPVWFGRAFAVSMTLNGLGNPVGAGVAGLLASHSLAVALAFGASLAASAGVISLVTAGLRRTAPAVVETEFVVATSSPAT